MEQRYQATLEVNKEPVDLNPFIEQFVARTTAGAVSALRGAENIESLELSVRHGDVTVTVNGKDIEVTLFPNEILASTLTGMVSSLRGIGPIDSMGISVKVT
ncbi:MAG: hypothetical protein SVP26_09055 [Chloroflexota bacterium]|nr:hypothetical protein [Chloroflexota bacterium]